MPTFARIYPFDFLKYLTEVVFAARKLLLEGALVPWLDTLADRKFHLYGMYGDPWLEQAKAQAGTDLLTHCTLLGRDLGFQQPSRDPDFWLETWPQRACTSATCLERQRCPLHFHQQGDFAAELQDLLCDAVSTRCLGEGFFLGPDWNVSRYLPLLASLQPTPPASLTSLLATLGSRGHLVFYQQGNGGGIHGWLTPPETRQLAELLEGLPLPLFETARDLARAFETSPANGLPLDWTLHSLRLLAEQARASVVAGHGLLWGNDIHHLTANFQWEV